MDLFVVIAFILLFGAALLIPYSEGLYKKRSYYFIALCLLFIAFAARALCMNYATGDYNDFLRHWVEYFRQNGGFAGFSGEVGNYNVPYLYFLALFSYIDVSDLYLIKILSVIFDVVLAFAVMKLSGVFTHSAKKRLAAFLIALLLPTVVMNGAMWGQCDSIYAAFAVLALWRGLSDKPVSAMVFMALSFAFKLQAVFLLPIFLVLIIAGRMKLRHLLVFPLTYVVVILPAVLLGRPFLKTLTLYFSQAGTIGSGLNYNAPAFFAWFTGKEDAGVWSIVGVCAAALLVLGILLWVWRKRANLNNEIILGLALLFVLCIPFLLPHMHDRYFFLADVLTLVPAVLYARYFPITVCTSAGSLICYTAYFLGYYALGLTSGFAAGLILGSIILTVMFTADRLNSHRFDSPCKT